MPRWQRIRFIRCTGGFIVIFSYLNVLCRVGEYFSTEEFVGNTLAEQVHMSKYYFLRKFKEMTGVTVHTFLTDKRLIKACQGLREGQSITQVWQSCGFADYSSFLRNFKAAYGVALGRYLDFYPEGAALRQLGRRPLEK